MWSRFASNGKVPGRIYVASSGLRRPGGLTGRLLEQARKSCRPPIAVPSTLLRPDPSVRRHRRRSPLREFDPAREQTAAAAGASLPLAQLGNTNVPQTVPMDGDSPRTPYLGLW